MALSTRRGVLRPLVSVILFVLVLSSASTYAGEPLNDASKPVNVPSGLAQFGFPSVDRPWTREDYRRAVAALDQVSPSELPRGVDDEESLFSYMSVENARSPGGLVDAALGSDSLSSLLEHEANFYPRTIDDIYWRAIHEHDRHMGREFVELRRQRLIEIIGSQPNIDALARRISEIQARKAQEVSQEEDARLDELISQNRELIELTHTVTAESVAAFISLGRIESLSCADRSRAVSIGAQIASSVASEGNSDWLSPLREHLAALEAMRDGCTKYPGYAEAVRRLETVAQ